MEVLVVLVLLGLISSLLMDSLSHILRLRIHILAQQQTSATGALQAAWFNQLIGGLTPSETADNKFSFIGESRTLQGLTMQPLHSHNGIPSAVKLSLVDSNGKTALYYEADPGIRWLLATWPASNAAFDYLDSEGVWRAKWPQNASTEQQLPVAVRLQSSQAQSNLNVWLARVQGRRTPRPRISNIL